MAKDEPKESELELLAKDAKEAQVKIYEAKATLHRTRYEAELLNTMLIKAGLKDHIVVCW